jgi:type I restriction enzyme S subunit
MGLMTKQGYKQTEVGLIPEDWEILSIGDSLIFKNGLNKASEFFGYGTPIVNYMDVFNNYGIRRKDIDGKVFLSREEKKNFSAQKGDVFFTRTSETQEEIGTSAVLLESIKDCVFSGFILRGRPKNDIVAPEYYQYCLIPQYVRTQIISTSSYTTRALTNGRFLSKVKLVIPSTLTEQKAIATTLSDVDGLIASLEQTITKKKAIKQGAMQQLLTPPHKGGKRLPGFSGDWMEKTLGELGECIIGLTYKPADVSDSGTLVLRSSNIQNDQLSFKDNVFVKTKIPERLRTQIDDILVCVRNGSRNLIGKCARIDNRCVNESFGAFMSMYRSPYNRFISHVFKSYSIQKQIEENLGATINQITNKTLNSFRIWFPEDEKERISIASCIDDMDAEITQLKSKKAKYQAIKQGMMQELLTGKTRLV